MIWLLSQFQKVIGIFSGRQRSGRQELRSPNDTPEVTPFVDSSDHLSNQQQGNQHKGGLTRSDININTVAPVAKRVSLLPANPARELDVLDPQGAIATDLEKSATNSTVGPDLELVEDSDTHRKLDATAAAISAEEFASSTMPTAVSELMLSDSFTQPAAGDVTWSSSPVETHGNYQPPSIHDLLPAIEPEEVASEGLDTQLDTQPETQPDPQPAEQATLFSFDIYESEEDAVEEVTEITKAEVAEAETEIDDREGIEVGIEAGIEADDQENVEIGKANSSVAVDLLGEAGDPALTAEAEETLPLYSLLEPSDHDEEQNSEEPNYKEPSDQERVSEEQIDEVDREQLSVSEALPLPPLETEPTATPALEVASPLAPDLETNKTSDLKNAESLNPWLTAVPATARESAQASSATELESKPGTVKLLFTIKPGNYHGYITPDDGSKDILFHQKYINADIFDKIERGTSVVATFKVMAGKAYATHIDLL
ncbi:cold shock domain-containing protein [cf. Phormidesmis sp. LEGE 11477]|uniref:cold shock domain-containing protein n=1 Tax=cf. Phormidesmis sp. LEGE 11477 TaxID=1828680 RepID=UPI001881EA3D|nr:cold shock domain-containing protein [cf. Phormidesmis sp. LEGE 11477]MBE9063286.1 cold shock domain-containing protein [cf. Phormidesmis sp. LEGE 11477]